MATESNGPQSVKSPQHSRSIQACKRCRALKARCLSSDQPGICQRCLVSNRDCIWPEIQQRTRLSRGPSRISQVEKKLDGLVARIGNQNTSGQANTPDPASQDSSRAPASRPFAENGYASPASTPGQLGRHSTNQVADGGNSHQMIADIHTFGSDPEDEQQEPALDTSRQPSLSSDGLGERLLSSYDCGSLLQQYVPMSTAFPFVPVEPKVSAYELAKRKPMLLLAIMIAASRKDRSLQTTLEKLYKSELADRVIINPRKSLELLQSVLVYIAWCHFIIEPKFQDAALLQTAIGLTIDLRLDPRSIPRVLPGRNVSKRVRGGKDGQRALLGCYYLCSVSACGLRTSNNFQFSPHMLESNKAFQHDSACDADQALSTLVNIQSLHDQMYDFLNPSGSEATIPTKDEILPRWQDWRLDLHNFRQVEAQQVYSHLIELSLYGTEVEFYRSVYHRIYHSERTFDQVACGMTVVEVLSACLESGRSFLDTLVSIPTEEFPLLPWPVLLRLPCLILTIAMLTSHSKYHSSEWDVKLARDRVRLDLYLESLCFRMQNLTTYKPPDQPNMDFWSALKLVLESVSKWYKKTTNRSKSEAMPGVGPLQTSRPLDTWNTHETSTEISFSGVRSAHTQSVDTFVCTPNSVVDSTYAMPDPSRQVQPQFQSVMCPMMRVGTGFDLDQFMETGFWGDDFGSINTFGTDFE